MFGAHTFEKSPRKLSWKTGTKVNRRSRPRIQSFQNLPIPSVLYTLKYLPFNIEDRLYAQYQVYDNHFLRMRIDTPNTFRLKPA